MHGVVAGEVVFGRQVTCSTSEGLVDPDDERRGVKGLQVCDRGAISGGVQAAWSTGGRQRRPRLGVGENADGRGLTRAPQPDREFGLVLFDDKLDQGRGVEVEGQRRWSATRSDTVPFALTRGCAGARDALGAVTSP